MHFNDPALASESLDENEVRDGVKSLEVKSEDLVELNFSREGVSKVTQFPEGVDNDLVLETLVVRRSVLSRALVSPSTQFFQFLLQLQQQEIGALLESACSFQGDTSIGFQQVSL